MADVRGEVTGLLVELKLGRQDALDRLMPLVYRELRRIAGNQMRNERVGHTLEPTALVHEAFLRLVDQSRADWQRYPDWIMARLIDERMYPEMENLLVVVLLDR